MKTAFRFDMTPWKVVICEQTAEECRVFIREEGIMFSKLPAAPEPGRIPEGADHVHIVAKSSGERDAREDAKWRALMRSTARCEHGRIAGQACALCPFGRVADNTGMQVGTTMSGKVVAIPAPDRLDDISAWIAD